MSTSTTGRRTMLVIGGGIGGLSTGCYAQMNGYQTRILEMHENPGGCCTAWDRGDYTFDPTVSWLLGSGPGNDMHQIWRELGGVQGKQIRNFDVFNIVQGRDGRKVYFYSDPDRLQAHLLDISPQDAEVIKDFCRGLRKFGRTTHLYPFLSPQELMGAWERLRLGASFLPYANLFRKSAAALMSDYSAQFRDPLLREAFNYVLYERHPAFPVLPYYFQLAMHANNSAGVPEGGSMGLARSIEARYLRLGGQISYNTKVEQVLVENDAAVGVRLTSGEELRADVVVAACDGHTALMQLLNGRYLTDEYRRMYTQTINEHGMTFPGFVVLFLGLRHQIAGAKPCTTFLLDQDEAAKLVGLHHPSVNVQFRTMHYPELAPGGKSVLYAAYFCDIAPWRELNGGLSEQTSRVRGGERLHTLPVRHGQDYYRAKHQVRDALLGILERRLPGINKAIAARDLSTPLTHIRYTGNYNGTVLGWMPFADSGETVQGEVKKYGPAIPGLANFYMSGVWTTTGGLIRAAASGRHVMQYVCRDDGRTFTASVDDSLPPPTYVTLPVGPDAHPPVADITPATNQNRSVA